MKVGLLAAAGLAVAAPVQGIVLQGYKITAYEEGTNCTGEVKKEVFVPSALCTSDILQSAGANVGSASYEYVVANDDVTVDFKFFLEQGCTGTAVVSTTVQASAWWAGAVTGCITRDGFDFKATPGSFDTNEIFTRVVVAGKKCAELGIDFESSTYLKAALEAKGSGGLIGNIQTSANLLLDSSFGNEALVSGSCQVTTSGTASYSVDQGTISWYATADCSGEVRSNAKCFDDEDKDANVVGPVEQARSQSAPSPATSTQTAVFLSSVLCMIVSLFN